jgi:hypothetical protein
MNASIIVRRSIEQFARIADFAAAQIPSGARLSSRGGSGASYGEKSAVQLAKAD